jgi:hypothetical protein
LHLSSWLFLAVGVTAAPFRLAAQESTPQPVNSGATSAAGAATAQAAEPPKADSDEEAQTRAFRLEGPLVKATSKALHLSLETTARIFEFTNFAIIALAIAIPLFRLFPAMLRKRSKTLTESLESARKMTEDANARLSAVEAKLASLDEQIAQFRAEVERESLATKPASRPLSKRSAPASFSPPSRRSTRPPLWPVAGCATLPPTWPSIRPHAS